MPPEPEANPEGDSRALDANDLGFRLLLVGMAIIGPFSLNIFKPCLPWIKSDFGAPITTVQLALSLSILAAAVATVLSGVIADRVGRRGVVLTSLYVYVASSAASALAPTIAVLVAGRVLQAASSSVVLTTARTILHDVHDRRRSTQEIARVTMIAGTAILLAPALGGVLIDTVSWRAIFWLTAALGVGILLSARASLPETGRQLDRTRAVTELLGHSRGLLSSPVFLGYVTVSSLHFAAFFAFSSAAAYLMVDVLQRPASAYGVWFVVLATFVVAGLKLADRLSSRVRAGRMVCAGSALVLMGCCLAAWYLTAVELTPLRLFLPSTITAFGVGFALPGSNSGVMNVVPELAGTASGLMGFAQFVVAAGFAQIVVLDESRTPAVLAALLLAAGVIAFGFSLLSVGDGGVRTPADRSTA